MERFSKAFQALTPHGLRWCAGSRRRGVLHPSLGRTGAARRQRRRDAGARRAVAGHLEAVWELFWMEKQMAFAFKEVRNEV